MRKINVSILCALVVFTVVSGWGCSRGKVETVVPSGVTGPKALETSGLKPDELTKRLNLASSSVLVLEQKFSGQATTTAKAMHLGGQENERILVIKRFAPANLAEVEWKLSFKDEKGADQQFVGALAGSDLQASHELYLPALWPEGVRNAYGSGVLWLSSDAYENLTKSGLSTFGFGLLDTTITQNETTSTGVRAALLKLQDSVSKVPSNVDVSLTKAATTTEEWPLKVNGVDSKVQVYRAKNWFGEMVFLANPQNPLVLQVKLNELPDGSVLNGLLDYKITEIREVQG